MEPIPIIALVLAVTVGIRILAGAFDGDRIRRYLETRGARLLSKQWTPFGRGWFGESTARIYLIEFADRSGNRRRATVKTSLFTGVFLTDEVVIEPAPQKPDELARLRAENERLRAELEQRSEQ